MLKASKSTSSRRSDQPYDAPTARLKDTLGVKFCAFIASKRLGTLSFRTGKLDACWVNPRLPSQKSHVAMLATIWSGTLSVPVSTEAASRPYRPVSVVLKRSPPARSSNMPICSQVSEILCWKPRTCAFWEGAMPRDAAHSRSGQPSGSGTQISPCEVDGRMWNCCGGVPTSIVQEDQLPLLPSQIPLGSRVSGIGIDMLAVSVRLRLSYLTKRRERQGRYPLEVHATTATPLCSSHNTAPAHTCCVFY